MKGKKNTSIGQSEIFYPKWKGAGVKGKDQDHASDIGWADKSRDVQESVWLGGLKGQSDLENHYHQPSRPTSTTSFLAADFKIFIAVI